MCKYCSFIIKVETHLLFVHSLRDGDFELNALDELCRWFLAFSLTTPFFFQMVTEPCK